MYLRHRLQPEGHDKPVESFATGEDAPAFPSEISVKDQQATQLVFGYPESSMILQRIATIVPPGSVNAALDHMATSASM